MRKMNYGYFGLTPYSDINLWFDESDNKWKTYKECLEHLDNNEAFSISNYAYVLTYKAAKRHLRKHKEIPVGTKFLLSSLYVGQDRILTKKKDNNNV